MPHQTLYLAIDQGSHATRATILDAQHNTHAQHHQPLQTRRPIHNHVEHDPNDILASARTAITTAWTAAGRPPIAAAALATQRSTIVCWDRHTARHLSPAISWQDTRTAATIHSLNTPDNARTTRTRTGLPLSPHYGATKLRWCFDNIHHVRAAAADKRLAWGPLAAFLLHNLLEESPHLIDPANAARTLLFDLATRDWSDQQLHLFTLADPHLRTALPTCVPTRHPYGTLRLDPHQPPTPNNTTPLIICTGDQSAVPFSLADPGPAAVTINAGTGAFIQVITGRRPLTHHTLLTSIIYTDAHPDSALYTLEATVNGAAAAIDWLAKQLHTTAESLLSHHAAQQQYPAPHIPLFLNGIAGLGSPYWLPNFISKFIPDTQTTPNSPNNPNNPAHYNDQAKLTAVFDSIAFLITTNLQSLAHATALRQPITITGGLAQSDYLCQTLADAATLTLQRSPHHEATTAGLAHLLTHPQTHTLTNNYQPTPPPASSTTPTPNPTTFHPNPHSPAIPRYHRWQSAMRRALNTP